MTFSEFSDWLDCCLLSLLQNSRKYAIQNYQSIMHPKAFFQNYQNTEPTWSDIVALFLASQAIVFLIVLSQHILAGVVATPSAWQYWVDWVYRYFSTNLHHMPRLLVLVFGEAFLLWIIAYKFGFRMSYSRSVFLSSLSLFGPHAVVFFIQTVLLFIPGLNENCNPYYWDSSIPVCGAQWIHLAVLSPVEILWGIILLYVGLRFFHTISAKLAIISCILIFVGIMVFFLTH